jgi:hypothetical protein
VQIVAASGKEMGKIAVEQMMDCGGAGCDQGKRVGSYLRGSVLASSSSLGFPLLLCMGQACTDVRYPGNFAGLAKFYGPRQVLTFNHPK